jgi:hypothetical protein
VTHQAVEEVDRAAELAPRAAVVYVSRRMHSRSDREPPQKPKALVEPRANTRSGTLRAVTSQGSPHARFRRALLTKNLTIIDAAAAELGWLDLGDALRVLRVMAEKRDPRFRRAAARFAARVTTEKQLEPLEAHRVLALAEALPQSPDAIGVVLESYC